MGVKWMSGLCTCRQGKREGEILMKEPVLLVYVEILIWRHWIYVWRIETFRVEIIVVVLPFRPKEISRHTNIFPLRLISSIVMCWRYSVCHIVMIDRIMISITLQYHWWAATARHLGNVKSLWGENAKQQQLTQHRISHFLTLLAVTWRPISLSRSLSPSLHLFYLPFLPLLFLPHNLPILSILIISLIPSPSPYRPPLTSPPTYTTFHSHRLTPSYRDVKYAVNLTVTRKQQPEPQPEATVGLRLKACLPVNLSRAGWRFLSSLQTWIRLLTSPLPCR